MAHKVAMMGDPANGWLPNAISGYGEGIEHRRDNEPERTARSLNLTTAGLTLFGVLLGIGTTVGFGLDGPWWLRVGGGALTTFALVVAVKIGTTRGRGPLFRAARWTLGSPLEDPDAERRADEEPDRPSSAST